MQYWCLHPLGPYAEMLRAQFVTREAESRSLRLRIWVAQVSEEGIDTLGFDEAETHGLLPFDLISDDHGPCQDVGRARLLAGTPAGLRVPSAALPGTDNVVLFGPRVASPYLLTPLGAVDVPTSIAAEGASPPANLLPLVRSWGRSHVAYQEWTKGEDYLFREPDPDSF